MSDDVTCLRGAAKEATKGAWCVGGSPHQVVCGSTLICETRNTGPAEYSVHILARNANARFIAAASPQRILRLLARLEQAEKALEEYRDRA